MANGGQAYRIRRRRAHYYLTKTATPAPEPVVYSIRLTATNAGGSDAETKTDYITVNQ